MNQEQWSARAYDTFQTIAEGYDSANARISLGLQSRWKQELIRHLSETAAGGAVLDVCCGTGDIALGLAARRPDLDITGLDFSPAMLDAAGKKRPERAKVAFQLGDAGALPYESDTFDAACVSFGLRNTPDWGQTLRELARVVRPGGSVFCLDSFVPERPWVRLPYRVYFQYLMPLLGGGVRRRPEYQWLYESTRDFLRGTELEALFAQCGLQDIQRREHMFGACLLIWGKKPGMFHFPLPAGERETRKTRGDGKISSPVLEHAKNRRGNEGGNHG